MAKHTTRPADLARNAAKDALAVTGDAAATSARKLAALTDVGPFGGFKKFISRGSMIDMAVGVVMGSAVTGVVNAIVADLINPLIAALGGKADMSGILNIALPNDAVISFGAILNAVLNFLLVGVAVYFCVILPINKLRDMTTAVLERDAADAAADAADAEARKEADAKARESQVDAAAAKAAAEAADVNARTLAVLEEIRDELKRANAGRS
ncbi:mechanosensitive ion channel protein MscL [Bifidobacterium sp. DSM 109958]|uniref:Mechanosensitive ion channel protein MscL n=1 Tax=Bifidobacterium moraviense TaxID=2675323 RepID=A0A7Y0F2I7_9BIFI|nr:large conductance mechanosensitive channel protein MscL [Bifidobacterium sp. DSM 109958]NMN00839.1 mechanosensitive ion channel protein MscL [Bifidobacterium sp. DSM 109958]